MTKEDKAVEKKKEQSIEGNSHVSSFLFLFLLT